MNTQKPTLIHVIAWMTLASGLVNLFWGLAFSATALATIIGVICTPLTILPSILGVFELIYAAKLFSNPPQAVQPSTNLAVFEIASVLVLNVFSVAVGILTLVFYNDVTVKDYFARLNGNWQPTSAVPNTSASLPEPIPAPVEEINTAPESSTPANEEPPANKPKRGSRKVAK